MIPLIGIPRTDFGGRSVSLTKSLMKFLTKLFHITPYRVLLGVLIGAALGYLYYYFVGCYSGTCAIQSSPVNMTIYGAVLGGLILELIHDFGVMLYKKVQSRSQTS